MRVEIVVSMRKKMGEIVTDRLEENFRELMNYDFTAADGKQPRPGGKSRSRVGKLYWITSSRISPSN
ncbi:DNA topoisomerase I [Escherichia coli]|uniref:DNA topoisomerase I n=1 Tax=Escherichia coli TaxID=562 RepID=A0A377K7A8_ECOLX|nr:DNA topoisomerase I [Escherichia coli]